MYVQITLKIESHADNDDENDDDGDDDDDDAECRKLRQSDGS